MPIFRICFRRDTAENWQNNNPILLKGEVGYEVDDKKAIKSKMGDGYLASDGKIHGTPWNDLPYVSGPPGPAGLTPEHKWEGSRLLFQNPDGTWDEGQSLMGPVPAHRWLGTSLQWETPSGAWGDAVDLQGTPGSAYSLPPATPTQLGGVMIGDGLTVNENGCVSTTPISAATTAKAGIVQLSSAVNSTSETLAATPKAVKAAYDKASAAQSSGNPVGTVIAFAGNSTPSGYLLCNGASVSRSTYAALFSVIGTIYGSGNGSTTFNLPDFRNRVMQGANNNHGTVIQAGLPNATGQFITNSVDWSGNKAVVSPSGVFSSGAKSSGRNAAISGETNAGSAGLILFKLSSSNSIYGKSSTVQMNAISVNIFIKY